MEPKKPQLVLFHTEGSYEDDWEPMTPFMNESSCKWNGQKHHRDDHLMMTHGDNVIVLSREKKNKPFTYKGKFKNIALFLDTKKGIPKKYKLVGHDPTQFNNISYNTTFERVNDLPPMASALYSLGLERIKGNHLGGIQLCRYLCAKAK